MAGLYSVGSPAPATMPLHGLQASGIELQDPDRWEDGIMICPEGCIEVATWDPDCAAWPGGDPPTKSEAAEVLDCYYLDPYVLETPFQCSSIGFQALDYAARARRQMEAGTSKAMEYELWTGTLKPDNPHLASTDATIIGASAAFSAAQALTLLGQALSNCGAGSRGTIHAPTFVVDAWLALGGDMIAEDGTRLVTRNRGDVIISGTGYPGTSPAGADPAENTSWVYATGPVTYRLGEIITMPETFTQALDRRTNRVEYRSERVAIANFDPCCHFAILVDVSVCE